MNNELDDLLDDFIDEIKQTPNPNAVVQQATAPTPQYVDDDEEEEKLPESDVIIHDNIVIDNINMDGKNVAQVLGLDTNGVEITKSDYSLNHLEIDIDTYQDIFDISTVMQNSVNVGKQILDVFDKLNADIFLSLFKYKPEILPEASMKKSTKINNKLMKRIVDTPEYRRLRQTCKLDMFNSALGTEVIGRKAIEILDEMKEEMEQRAEELGQGGNAIDTSNKLAKQEELIDELIEEIEDIDALIEDAKQSGNNPDPSLTSASNSAKLSLAQAQAIAKQLEDELDDQLEIADDILEEAVEKISNTFEEADDYVGEVSEMVDMWGFNPGSEVRVSMQGKKEAVERLRKSKKLKDLSKLIGRFKESALRDQKQKSKNGATSIKSVTIGNNIQHVLPSEKMSLINNTTKRDFYRKYNQKELLMYELENTNKKNKGPMICCIDISGSMSGGREKWSKAVAIGLLEIAQEQKRNFGAILYDDKVQRTIVLEKGDLDPNKVVDIAEVFTSGGTDFQAPLEEAMKLIKDSKFRKADIVFITDGDCGLSDTFVKRFKTLKEEKEFNCIGIVIDAGGYAGGSDGTLKTFCDDIIKVSNLADLENAESDVAHKIFGGV